MKKNKKSFETSALEEDKKIVHFFVINLIGVTLFLVTLIIIDVFFSSKFKIQESVINSNLNLSITLVIIIIYITYIAKQYGFSKIKNSFQKLDQSKSKNGYLALFFIFPIIFIVLNDFLLKDINYLSSIFSEHTKHNSLVREKNIINTSKKTIYKMIISDWKDNGKSLELSLDYYKWNNFQNNMPIVVITKKGIFNDVLFDITQ